eukprot:CAMPEP_0171462746 /NCGR_PEP_ID=MMETSP0945-20130129/6654_1 /TAXON_ID=109269 /ORGANISM="Vaucheria litorea, Strain CCMP2940" /LENGTH=130 /DNA_ID=CAMNT_0011989321 /DNA_START=95 /DNA_END=487 /DNA_ORIENTATION=-
MQFDSVTIDEKRADADITPGGILIGAGVMVKGDISCDEIVVGGTLDINALQAKKLVIESGGKVEGKANANSAEIAGNFKGDLHLTDEICVKKAGIVRGKVRYRSLQVESGGRLYGDVQYDFEDLDEEEKK